MECSAYKSQKLPKHSLTLWSFLESNEGVRRDIKGGDLDVLEEVVEVGRLQYNLGQRLEPEVSRFDICEY